MKNNSVILKTCNQSSIEELGVCLVRLRHKDKGAKYRFIVVPGDWPALLGVSDVKLLNILKITCEIIGDPHENMKLDSKTIEASNGPSYKTKHCKLRQIM